MSEELLRVDSVSKKFGSKQALDNVTFTIESGKIVGLMGPNGAGKSTLLKCISNVLFPTTGNIYINGHSVYKNHTDAMKDLGITIESPQLYENLTGIDHLKLICAYYKNADINWAISYLGFEHALKKKVSTYSMGMRQRLVLAMAMMHKPKLLVLDEPTNGLDPQSVFQLRQTLQELSKQGTGILFSSHDLGEVEKIVHKRLFLNQGKLVSDVHHTIKQTYKIKVQDIKKIENPTFFTYHNERNLLIVETSKEIELTQILSEILKYTDILDIEKTKIDLEEIYRSIYA